MNRDLRKGGTDTTISIEITENIRVSSKMSSKIDEIRNIIKERFLYKTDRSRQPGIAK